MIPDTTRYAYAGLTIDRHRCEAMPDGLSIARTDDRPFALSLGNTMQHLGVILTLIVSPIRYCPFCGRRLFT